MLLRRGISSVAKQMVALVAAGVLDDLRNEDPATAVEVYYEPIRVHQLPHTSMTESDCSVDGYYDPFIDPARPRILYSQHGGPARARFTILHELGHHIINTDGQHLLDDLDQMADSPQGAQRAQEQACHQFAGEVLVPIHLLNEVLGSGPVEPLHVLRLREKTKASWEVLAIRAANHSTAKTAIALIRQPGTVSFVATNWPTSWPRGSTVKPRGPLDQALRHNWTARQDTYRYGLGGAEALFCDTFLAHRGLAIAVMSTRRTGRGLSVLVPEDPLWKQSVTHCAWCSGERTVGWCHRCAGQRCQECDRCGCRTPARNPTCPRCQLQNPFQPGASVCIDCEDFTGINLQDSLE